MTTDVNEHVESEWVDEISPFERVRSVLAHRYEPRSVGEIAEAARTNPGTARRHLRTLAENGFAEESSDPGRDGALYWRSPESLAIEQARRIRAEVDHDHLAERIDEMRGEIRGYEERFSAGSPEDTALLDTDIDAETLRDWQTTRRNLSFTEVALALYEALDIIRDQER